MILRCPECGEEIIRLYQDVYTETTVYSLDSEGRFTERNWSEVYDEIGGFYCPECFEELAETKEEAIKFLNKSELEIKIEESLEEVEQNE